MRPHDLKERKAVEQHWRFETGIENAAPCSVARWRENADIVLLIGIGEQPAHPPMRETEDRREVAALHHLATGHDLIAVLRPIYVRPKQTAERVMGREFIARGDCKRT